MRKTIAWLPISVLLLGMAVFDSEGWRWERPVLAEGAAPGYVRLPISEEIFDAAQPSLNDLRIVGPDGTLAPHVVFWSGASDRVQTVWRDVDLFNAVYNPDETTSVTLDFGEAVRKNLLRVRVEGENFRRLLSVEGSADNRDWQMLAEDLWLWDIHYEGRIFVLDTLTLPENDFRYLRLTVHHPAEDLRRLRILGAEAAFRETVTAATVAVPVRQFSQHVDEKTGETVVDLDLGFRNLPLAEMRVDVEDAYFHRGYHLLGRDSEVQEVRVRIEGGWKTEEQETPWISVSSGVIYRINDTGKTAASLTISPLSSRHRYLQLRIDNADNPALRVSKVELMRREASVVFQHAGEGSYRLVGGNETAAAPRYDLARTQGHLSPLELPVVAAGPSVALVPTEDLPPWTERHTAVLWGVLILAVGMMAALLLTNLKSLSSKPKTD